MADLAKDIADLKSKIEGYEVDLKNATSPDEKSGLRRLISSSRENLTELWKQQSVLNKST
jgi:hypothetical protein